MSVTYLWIQEPFISSPPILRLEHSYLENSNQEIDEFAVFKLNNDKFLFIRFCGTKKDLSLGFTELEEFNTEEEAVDFYNKILKEETNE